MVKKSPFEKSIDLYGFSLTLFYGFTSILITLINKSVLSSYNFSYPNILSICQMSCAVIFLYIFRSQGWIQFKNFNPNLIVSTLPLASSFSGMVAFGLWSLEYLNIPMFSTLRRLTSLLVMAASYLIHHVAVPTEQILAVFLMTAGAFIAGISDLTFSSKGYILALFTCIFNTSYLIYIKKAKDELDLNIFESMLYNNLLSIPMVTVIAMFKGEFSQLSSFMYWNDFRFQCIFFLSCVLAFVLNFSIFLCTRYNSPLTTSITGQIKSILASLFGAVLFNDIIVSFWNIFGISLSTVCSAWYSQLKYVEQKQKQERRKM